MNPDLTNRLISRAKLANKTIVLPESNDKRVLDAALFITSNKIAELIILGNRTEILKDYSLLDCPTVRIINPESSNYLKEFSDTLYQIRKEKGLTCQDAEKLIVDPLYFGTMLVHKGLADGMVAGANHYSADVIRPALQIIKAKPGKKIISSFFIMISPNKEYGHNGIFVFSDCGININPNPEELAQIAIDSANTFETLVEAPARVAMLSYSTYSSGKGESVDKVKKATEIAKLLNPHIILDGELQVDAAIVPAISQKKSPQSQIQGQANVLIFPDINSANISYKLVQRLGNTFAFGPITQGIAKPINDLSRACSVEDIVSVVAITAIQSQNSN